VNAISLRSSTLRLACVLLAGALALAGCGSSAAQPTTAAQTTTAATAATTRQAASASGCTKIPRPPLGARSAPKPTTTLPATARYEVTFTTNCGSFTMQIDQADAPHAAAAFVELVKRGYFNGTIFHRIVPGFVIQGGDPTGTGTGGPGFTTVDPPASTTAYTHGVVAMAKTATAPAGAAGSQFFVVTEPNAGLPPDYAVIGKVVSGLAVVDRIGLLGNAEQQPTMVVEIEKATLTVSG
jgi:cyclophilin family peptidyl-prolyl cis-trans isomerase